ncbi:MAG: hemerythrin domain-containing protein [Leptospiraceae bacterium]|nr:hemerythrin domain-containing protein [Leptospiraceae bacterium]
MSITSQYRSQHAELADLAEQLLAILDAGNLAERALEVTQLLTLFAARLKVHLSMEDLSLYPRLIQSANPSCAETALQFQSAMGGLQQDFEQYMTKWSVARRIQADTAAFIGATHTLLQALHTRMDKENKILYPLAEQQP